MINFQIFIPAYNVDKFIGRCVASVVIQRSSRCTWEVLIVDDASDDFTGIAVDAFAETRDWVTVVRNVANMKMPYNLRHARQGDPEDVVFILDADDYLPHEHVLDTLAQHYQDSDLWLTYGSYTKYPPQPVGNPALPYPNEVIWNREFRTHNFSRYNHPLTFRRKVWQQVEDWELQDDDGHWFGRSYDHVIMMPMLELAAGHFRWLPDNLYVYNEENPLSEAKLDDPGLDPYPIINMRGARDPMCKYFPHEVTV